MKGCITQPISWLRLERYGLGELPSSEHDAIDRHLADCEVCRACFAAVETARELPDLPLPGERPRPAWLRWPAWAGGLSAALVAVALLLWPPQAGRLPEVPPARLHVKGGELTLELVRLDDRGHQLEADRFEPDDRWKILLTCPAALRPHVDTVVYQGGRAFFPLDARALERCDNRVALPGAFRLDGIEPALVCVAVAETEPLPRAVLAKGPAALPELSVCARVVPVRAPR